MVGQAVAYANLTVLSVLAVSIGAAVLYFTIVNLGAAINRQLSRMPLRQSIPVFIGGMVALMWLGVFGVTLVTEWLR